MSSRWIYLHPLYNIWIHRCRPLVFWGRVRFGGGDEFAGGGSGSEAGGAGGRYPDEAVWPARIAEGEAAAVG